MCVCSLFHGLFLMRPASTQDGMCAVQQQLDPCCNLGRLPSSCACQNNSDFFTTGAASRLLSAQTILLQAGNSLWLRGKQGCCNTPLAGGSSGATGQLSTLHGGVAPLQTLSNTMAHDGAILLMQHTGEKCTDDQTNNQTLHHM